MNGKITKSHEQVMREELKLAEKIIQKYVDPLEVDARQDRCRLMGEL